MNDTMSGWDLSNGLGSLTLNRTYFSRIVLEVSSSRPWQTYLLRNDRGIAKVQEEDFDAICVHVTDERGSVHVVLERSNDHGVHR